MCAVQNSSRARRKCIVGAIITLLKFVMAYIFAIFSLKRAHCIPCAHKKVSIIYERALASETKKAANIFNFHNKYGFE